MNIRIYRLVFAFVIAAFTFPLQAADQHGSSEEAVALVKKAIDFYKKNGAEKAYQAINNHDPAFKNKDLYLFASDVKLGAPLAAHGANPKMVGKDMSQLKDVDGNYFAKKMVELAQSKEGKGWVDYKWPNPINGQIEQKSTYVERIDDIYFGCGIYK
ncbi:cache domain-containing protein [Undibacterium sp. RuRC25W]|uniref:cache domain-containing protein n=1 Tax=Undibacterium sp. RuRC25W TaxID=3413047 RepID=UPI003BF3AFDA